MWTIITAENNKNNQQYSQEIVVEKPQLQTWTTDEKER